MTTGSTVERARRHHDPREGRHSHEHRRRSGRRGSDTTLFGALLVVVGLGWFFHRVGVVTVPWRALWALVLFILGLGLVMTARTSHRKWPIALGVVITLGLASGSTSAHIALPTAGERLIRPATVEELERSYRLMFGTMTIDLTDLEREFEGVPVISGRVWFGELEVIVPEGMAVEVEGKVRAGEMTVFGERPEEGLGVERRYQSPGFEHQRTFKVRLLLKVISGEIGVRHAHS